MAYDGHPAESHGCVRRRWCAIPLEAMRLDCEAIANDYNPVAWFILKCTLEYPQRFAGKTAKLPDLNLDEPPDLTNGDLVRSCPFVGTVGFGKRSKRTCTILSCD